MKKYILTGGPCSGKTWVGLELERRGYCFFEEVARDVLSARGKYAPLRDEWLIREAMIFDRMIMNVHIAQRGEGVAFMDRGFGDFFVYLRRHIGDLNNFKIPRSVRRYDGVFLLDLYPFEKDGLRIEGGSVDQERLHELIAWQYRKMGYDLVEVPKMDLLRRVDFILDHVRVT